MRRATGEQRGEDFLEVGVYRLVGPREIVLHARIDDAVDLRERLARAVEVGKLACQIVVAHLERVVLVGGVGIDRAQVGDAAAQLEGGVLHFMAILELRARERRLERRAATVDNLVDRGLDLYLQTSFVHTSSAHALAGRVVGVVSRARLRARLVRLGMQPQLRILRLRCLIFQVNRPATGALRELLEHRKQRLYARCGKFLRTMGQTLRLRLSGKLSELPCARIADADSVGLALHKRRCGEACFGERIGCLLGGIAQGGGGVECGGKTFLHAFQLVPELVGQARILLHVGTGLRDDLLRLRALPLDVLELVASRSELLRGSVGSSARGVRLALGGSELLAFREALPLRRAQGSVGGIGSLLRLLRLLPRGDKLAGKLLKPASAREGALSPVVDMATCDHLARRPHDAPVGRDKAQAERVGLVGGEGLLKVFAHDDIAKERANRTSGRLGERKPLEKCPAQRIRGSR